MYNRKNTYLSVLAGDSGNERGLGKSDTEKGGGQREAAGRSRPPGQCPGMSPCACGLPAPVVLVITQKNANQIHGQGQESGGAGGSN